MTPIIGDLIESTVGKVVGKLADHYLPASMSEAEKANFKLKAMEMTQEQLKTDAQAIESVNKTMREEAKSDKWWQSAWRPTVGFTFSAVVINNYIIMAYMVSWAKPIDIPSGVWKSMLVILGAAAGTRGFEKIADKIKDRWKKQPNRRK